jgi:hypothetical protein
MNTPPLQESLEKLSPYLEAAEAHGMRLRPITGLMLRLGDQFGVDIDAVGEVGQDAATEGDPPDEYYDQLAMAVWVLAENEETLVDAAAGGHTVAERAFLRWKLAHFTSHEAEASAMRAFVARWFEHRLEMARLYGIGESSAADA